jgi:hypothetical protein
MGTKTGKSIHYGLYIFVAVLLIKTGWMTVQDAAETEGLYAELKGW